MILFIYLNVNTVFLHVALTKIRTASFRRTKGELSPLSHPQPSLVKFDPFLALVTAQNTSPPSARKQEQIWRHPLTEQ